MRQQFKRTNGMSRIARGLIAVIVGLALAVQPQCAVAQSQIAPAATGRFVDQVFQFLFLLFNYRFQRMVECKYE